MSVRRKKLVAPAIIESNHMQADLHCMDIKECHRVLELEIGASRIEVDNAYCRLLERWHPDHVAPADDPEALREATHMVQVINDAYQTLIKTAPLFAAQTPEPAIAPRKKPALPPLTSIPVSISKAPVANKPTSAPPPALPAAPSVVTSTAPVSATNVGSSGAPPLTPLPAPPPPSSHAASPAPVPNPPAANAATTTPPASTDRREKVTSLHDALFPVGSLQRKFSLIILVALFLLLLAKCAFSSSSAKKTARPPDPSKTGSVVIKSNRADTEVELTRVVAAQDGAASSFHGSGAQSTLTLMSPGKYFLVAKSAGWPEIRQEVKVDVGPSAEVAVHFKSGSLRLNSDPVGATVQLGSAVLGKTPLVIAQLPPGESQLSLQIPGWPVVSVKTTITENVESVETVRLPYGKVVVETTPLGATVLLGGKAVGQTPLTLDRVPAGIKKITLQAKDFPALEVSVTVEDRGEAKISREMASAFPELNAPKLLSAVWVPDDPNKLSPGVDSLGHYEPRNGIVRNLHRKRLYENWLKKKYRYSATIKSYDRESGKIEFAEQADALSKYRILAELSPAARNNPDLIAQLIKGATLSLYGRLDAVEEPRWPLKVITFELSLAEPML